MRDVHVAIPGDPATITGGYLYDRRLMEALPSTGWQPKLLSLPDGFPFPSTGALQETAVILTKLSPRAIVLADGLAFGAIPESILRGCRATFVALVHHPLAVETGLTRPQAKALFESERAALTFAKGVVTTSPRTAERVAADFSVPRSLVTVAVPGTTPGARARGSADHVPHLLCVATLTPRKGHDVLIAALAKLKDIPWRLTCIGNLARDAGRTITVRQQIAALGLEERVTLAGERGPDELAEIYDSADIFVLPSRDEGYGMAFAEALAHGLPVIACAAGAVPETVPADAGILVPVDAVSDLSDALRQLLTDKALRERMGDAAWNAGRKLPTWADTAQAVAGALDAASSRRG